MAIRSVLKMGESLLREFAAPVTQFDTPQLNALIADMRDTMEAYEGIGLAAPQIGESLQVVLFGFENSLRYPEAPFIPQTVLINPVLTFLSTEEEEGWEGCLSIPGLKGKVLRHTRLRYQGFDEKGQVIDQIAEGWHARVVQHECDHLWGILYPQRMRDMSTLCYVDVMLKVNQPSANGKGT